MIQYGRLYYIIYGIGDDVGKGVGDGISDDIGESVGDILLDCPSRLPYIASSNIKEGANRYTNPREQSHTKY